MNKNGLSEFAPVFSTILFLTLIFGASLAIAIGVVFGGEHDFRMNEAGILNYKIEDCINRGLFDGQNDFYQFCGLSKRVLSDELESNKMIVLVCEGKCDSGKKFFQLGSDFISCDFQDKEKKFVQCVKNDFQRNGKEFQIITGSNHNSRRMDVLQ